MAIQILHTVCFIDHSGKPPFPLTSGLASGQGELNNVALQVEAAQAAAAAASAAAATRRAAQATEIAQLREHLRQAESFLAQKARQVEAQVPAHLSHKVRSFIRAMNVQSVVGWRWAVPWQSTSPGCCSTPQGRSHASLAGTCISGQSEGLTDCCSKHRQLLLHACVVEVLRGPDSAQLLLLQAVLPCIKH